MFLVLSGLALVLFLLGSVCYYIDSLAVRVPVFIGIVVAISFAVILCVTIARSPVQNSCVTKEQLDAASGVSIQFSSIDGHDNASVNHNTLCNRSSDYTIKDVIYTQHGQTYTTGAIMVTKNKIGMYSSSTNGKLTLLEAKS
jgi:hypothetical protein